MQLRANTYYRQRNGNKGYCGCSIPDEYLKGCESRWVCIDANGHIWSMRDDGRIFNQPELCPEDFVEEWCDPEQSENPDVEARSIVEELRTEVVAAVQETLLDVLQIQQMSNATALKAIADVFSKRPGVKKCN